MIDNLQKQSLGEFTEGRDRFDYELHSWNGEWEIIAIDHGCGSRERLIAEFPTEAQADQAWEQIMACSGSDRGAMYKVSETPCWDIQWFDAVEFKIQSMTTKDLGLKNQTVMTLAEEGTPHRVRMAPIEHWSENPLLSGDCDADKHHGGAHSESCPQYDA